MRKKCKHTRLGNTSPKLTSKSFPQFDKANNGTWSKSQFRRGLSELEVKRRTTEWGTRVHEGWQSFSEHQVTQKILFEANTFFAPALRGLRHSSDNQKQEPKKYWLDDELACLHLLVETDDAADVDEAGIDYEVKKNLVNKHKQVGLGQTPLDKPARLIIRFVFGFCQVRCEVEFVCK